MENNELYHHGIKGMKWGVRRTPEQLGHKTSSKKKTASSGVSKLNAIKKKLGIGVKKTKTSAKVEKKTEEPKKEETKAEPEKKEPVVKKLSALETAKKSNLSEMSNAEIKALTDRMNLEKNYKDAMKNLQAYEATPRSTKVKQIFEKILTDAATDLGTQVAKEVGGRVINIALGYDTINTKYVSTGQKKKDEKNAQSKKDKNKTQNKS